MTIPAVNSTTHSPPPERGIEYSFQEAAVDVDAGQAPVEALDVAILHNRVSPSN